MFDVEKISKIIKEKRIEKNMTQLALADYMGVSYQAVSNWERGNSMPDISKLEDLCSVLDITVEELLGMESRAAKTVEKIISDSDEVSVEEIAEVAPILPPSTIREKVEKKKEKINFDELSGIIEYLDSDSVGELISGLIKTGEELSGIYEGIFDIIEFVPESCLCEIIEKTEAENLGFLADCIEDFGTKELDLFAKKCLEKDCFDIISDNAEFFGTETLSAIVNDRIEKNKISDLCEMIEELSESEVIKIIEKADEKGIEKLGECVDEFGKKATDLFIKKCLDNNRFDIISEYADSFSDRTLAMIVDDRIEKNLVSDLSEIYSYLSQSQLKRIAKIFMSEEKFEELCELKDYM